MDGEARLTLVELLVLADDAVDYLVDAERRDDKYVSGRDADLG
jgi:hypothetical protein